MAGVRRLQGTTGRRESIRGLRKSSKRRYVK